jgi:hypothetical protein
VTRLTIFSDPKSGITIMASTAGLAALHSFHGCLVGTALRLKYIGMAFIATEHFEVSGVREDDITVVSVFVKDITSMAGGAVTGHSKRGAAVMAGAARRAVCHRFHRSVVAIVLRLEEIGMALVATEQTAMNIMAEHHLADGLGLNHNITGMTLGAVASNAERLLPIVAGSTGSAPFHQFHGDVITVVLLFEECRMTRVTVCAMQAMAEDNFADSLGLYGEFIHHTSYTSHTAPHIYGMQNGRRRDYQ